MLNLIPEFLKKSSKLLENVLLISIILFLTSIFISYQPLFVLIGFRPISDTSFISALSVYGEFLGVFFVVLMIAAFFYDRPWASGNNLVFQLRDLFEKFWLIGSSCLFLAPCLVGETPQKIVQMHFYSYKTDFGLWILIFFSLLQLILFFLRLIGWGTDEE